MTSLSFEESSLKFYYNIKVNEFSLGLINNITITHVRAHVKLNVIYKVININKFKSFKIYNLSFKYLNVILPQILFKV